MDLPRDRVEEAGVEVRCETSAASLVTGHSIVRVNGSWTSKTC